MRYDAAIIGGGIAGLALAADLRRRNISVIVIEKGDYPRHKVCGEYISAESERYLLEICPALAQYEFPRIDRFQLSSTFGSYKTRLRPGGIGISRYFLERVMYESAVKAGVKVLTLERARDTHFSDGHFQVQLDHETIHATLLFDASGRLSNLDQEVKSRTKGNYVGVKYHIKWDQDPRLISLHNFSGGYAGISAVEDGKFCFCYMVNSVQLKKSGNTIDSLEKNTLQRNPKLKEIFTNAEFLNKTPVTTSGIHFSMKQTDRNGVLCIGDAAGCIAPLCGNGMSMGLRSASIIAPLCAEFISGKIKKPDLIERYCKTWTQHFERRIKFSSFLQKLTEYQFLATLSIGAFHLFPPLAPFLISKTHGKAF